MLSIKFKPPLLPARYRHTVPPTEVNPLIIQRRKIVKRFKLERFFDRKPDQNAVAVLVDAKSFGSFSIGKDIDSSIAATRWRGRRLGNIRRPIA